MDKKFVMSIAAMAALTLVSCSSDDLDSFSDNSSKNEAISFDGYLGRSAVAVNGTRGSEETVNTLKTKGFGMFGKYSSTDGQTSDANFFKNQKVTYSTIESKWTYSPLKFWPSDGHIDFLAYAPYNYDGTNTTLTGGSKINNFTVSGTIADQTDLLWTNAMSSISADLTSAKKKVNFQFHHALSRLGYTVKLTGDYSSDNVTFTLKKITLAGSPTDAETGAFYTSGTIDLSMPTGNANLWSDKTGKQKFDWFSGDYQVKSSTASHPDEPNKDKDYLFVIPQNFSEKIGGTENPDKLYVIVEYDVTYKSGTPSTTIKNKVYKQLTTNFLQGKAYNLNLTIGLPIEFDVDVTGSTGAGVDGWETPGDGTGDINIGSNENPWER
jgi:hypothetical protein